MVELSEPLENYLKEIYEIEAQRGHAKVSDLIVAFSVSPGTISKAISRLEFLGLIVRDRKGIRLTPEGKQLAERLIRSHRLSERLLTDVLGLDWIRAHEIAHRLEHIWPNDVLDRIDAVLGFPSTCPHGHPIPGRGEVKGTPLSQAQSGSYKVVMIVKEEEWILREAEKMGLIPGRVISVKKEGDKIFVMVDSKLVEVPRALAEQVMVNA